MYIYIYMCVYIYIHIIYIERYRCIDIYRYIYIYMQVPLSSLLSACTKVYSVIYDSGSIPRRATFSPRETQENLAVNQP